MQVYETIDALIQRLDGSELLNEIAIQSIDLSPIESQILGCKFSKCLFLGCTLSDALHQHLYKDNFIFPVLDLPFNTYPNKLYNWQSLYNGFDPKRPESYELCLDKVVYDYCVASKASRSIKDTLAQRLHDHSISESLHEYISQYEERELVAIMGGHRLQRTDAMYEQIVRLSKSLTERGYLMLSGGGPGAMEATHAGAWMAGRSEEELREALQILSVAPSYSHEQWLSSAFEMMQRFPHPRYDSLGIPTWHYGHELPTPLATQIAKYFENSLREEGLLAVAKGGVIFSPGSAGTKQEVFQDLAQNHYESYGYASPMIFLDREFWTIKSPIYPIIEGMAAKGDLKNLNLGLYDDNADIIAHIERFTQGEK